MIPVSGVSDPVGMGMCEVAMALMGMYLLDVLMIREWRCLSSAVVV